MTITVPLSIIIPVHNEEDNIPGLIKELDVVTKKWKVPSEVVIVDDASTDGTLSALKRSIKNKPFIRIIHLPKNEGKTNAWRVGFEAASHDIIATMDGDLQNSPADIPNLLKKLQQGFGMVSGYRKSRSGRPVQIFLSRVINRTIKLLTGIKLTDHGCGIKIFRKVALNNLEYKNSLHRFIGLWVAANGHKVTEIEVSDRPRCAGKSKFGIERLLIVPLDIFRFFKQNPSYAARSLLLLLTALGIFLRFWEIGRDNLWNDEMLSVKYAKLPVHETIYQLNKYSAHPPLYFWLLHLWMWLFGTSESAIRSLGAVFGIITIPLVYLVGKQIFNWRTGLIAAFLFTINPFQIRYAQEARAYTLLVFVALLTLLALYNYVAAKNSKKPTRKFIYFYSISNLLLVNTHIYGALIWVANKVAALIVLSKQKRATWLKAEIIPFLGLAALAPMYCNQISNTDHYNWLPKISQIKFLEFFADVPGSYCLLAIFLAPVIFLFSKRSERSNKKTLALLAWIIFVPLVSFLITIYQPIFHPRYFIASGVGFIILAAAGFDSIIKWQKKLGILLIIIATIFSFISLDRLYKERKQELTWAVEWMVENHYDRKDQVMFVSHWAAYNFLYYFHLPHIPITEPYIEFNAIKAVKPLHVMTDEEYFRIFNAATNNAKRIWVVVTDFSYPISVIMDPLKAKYHIVKMEEHDGGHSADHHGPITMILLDRNS